MRIASLCPSNTELICALGLEDKLIAVDNYSDTPADVVAALPRLGPDLQIDVDKLKSMKPDLVVSSLSVPGMEQVVANVEAAGLPQLVLSSQNLHGIFRDLEQLAAAVGSVAVKARAQACIAELSGRVGQVQEAMADIPDRPVLYWEWWPNPIFSPAADNWLTEISALAGARNLFADVPGSQVQDDGKRVLAGQPDYVFAVWTGVAQHLVPIPKILKRPGFESLDAIKKGRLYVLSEGLYCRPSPRLVDGLEQLTALLHPEVAARLALPAISRFAPVRNIKGEWLD